MIDRPSGPTAAMTRFSFVPGGKFTTRVPGSAPNSTLRSVVDEEVVDWVGVLTSGFVIFDAAAAISDSGVGGTTRAIGTPMTTTYTARNAPTKPRPYCTKSWKSPPAPLPPQRAPHITDDTRANVNVRLAFESRISPSTSGARATSLTSGLGLSPPRVLLARATPINSSRATRTFVVATATSRIGDLFPRW